MKTIATAAVLMMLSAPAWADDADKNEATSNEPMVLSEAELDEVTAGFTNYRPQFYFRTTDVTGTDAEGQLLSGTMSFSESLAAYDPFF